MHFHWLRWNFLRKNIVTALMQAKNNDNNDIKMGVKLLLLLL